MSSSGPPTLRVVVFDVGQGDSLLVRLADQGWGLVDCHYQPGKREPPALGFMRKHGIKDLEFVCLSHPDYDHYRGMVQVLKYVHDEGGVVKRFWIFGAVPARRIYEAFKRAASEAEAAARASGPADVVITEEERRYHSARKSEFAELVRYVNRMRERGAAEMAKPAEERDHRKCFFYRRLDGPDDVRQFGPVRVYCLAPTSESIATYEETLWDLAANPFLPPAPERENNSVSIVLGMVFGDSVVVLGGDAGRREWQAVLAARTDATASFPIRADFLKASHHGSRHAWTPEILNELAGTAWAVAVSADCSTNSFGHPHRETLEHLRGVARKGRLRLLCCTNSGAGCREILRGPDWAAKQERDVRHVYEMFSRRSSRPANTCFGTCVFEIAADRSVRLVENDGPVSRCRILDEIRPA